MTIYATVTTDTNPKVTYSTAPLAVSGNHKPRLKVVYIAGKYRSPTDWGIELNIREAETAALWVWLHGGVALCPHKNTAHFGGADSLPDSVWLEGDIELLRRCDGVLASPGWRDSKGASAEVALAHELGLPVWESGNITDERNLAVWLAGN